MMKVVLAAILVGSAAGLVVLHVTPLATLEIPLQGGNAFVPRIFGTAGLLTIDVFALGAAVWLLPSLLSASRIARELGSDEMLFVVQRTPELSTQLGEIGPRILIPTVIGPEYVTFHGTRGRVLGLTPTEAVTVNPVGYRGRFPVIEVTTSAGGQRRVLGLVVARDGDEFRVERREAHIARIVERLSRVTQ